MNTRVILSIILISLGSMAAILPKQKTSSIKLDADDLLLEIKRETYKISVDELAELLINQDPSVMLIDVRAKEDYDHYHLPGAINIPLKNLLDPEWLPYVDQLSKNNIFYSNGMILSGQAGIITKQLGFKNIFVLEGGLNAWFANIIKPEKPGTTASSDEFTRYEFRKGASMYFTGSKAVESESAGPALPPIPRKKKTRVAGGCS